MQGTLPITKVRYRSPIQYSQELTPAVYCAVWWHESPDYAWASTAGGEVLAYAYQKADRLDTQVR